MVHVHSHVHHLPWCTATHGHACACEKWRFALSALIALSFGTVEYLVGIQIASIAAQGDAFHLSVDGMQSVLSLVIAFKAQGHEREASLRKKGAYVQSLLLSLVAASIAYQALFHDSQPHSGPEMMALGGAATAVAVLRLWVVHHEWHHTLTGRGEVRHILVDVGTSAAVFLGGAFLWIFDIKEIDRVAALGIAFFALLSARDTWKDARSSHSAHP